MAERQPQSPEKTLEDFRNSIIHLFEEIWALRGTDRDVGRIYATVLLSNKPFTQKELVEITGYSRGQVSKTLKGLEKALFVTKSRPKGSREKVYYVGSGSFLKTFADRMKLASKMLRQQMKLLEKHEKAWIELPKEIQETPEARHILEVGETFYNYYDFYLSSMDEVIEKIERKIQQLDDQLIKKMAI
ncbi:MAG: GbsR/MarR family transcriptional regulator [Promethearchaeota archaeon]